MKIYNRVLMYFYKCQFSACGSNVIFFPSKSNILYRTIEIGDDVYIGSGATLLAADSFIKIKSKVLFGPNVSIIAGNHSTHILGKFLFDYDTSDKLKSDDEPVIIENDVWVGAGVTILKGSTIGRGTIIAAGAVVTRDLPSYCIAAGIPAKVIKFRWTVEEILRHEENLYPLEVRYSKELLEKNMKSYGK